MVSNSNYNLYYNEGKLKVCATKTLKGNLFGKTSCVQIRSKGCPQKMCSRPLGT